MVKITNRKKKQIEFSYNDIQAIRDYLKSEHSAREEDPEKSLIPGITNDGFHNYDVYVDLAKHHIISESYIRSELRKLSDSSKLKNQLESYLNAENNIESRKIFIEWTENILLDSNQV